MGTAKSRPSTLLWSVAVSLTLHELKQSTNNFGDVYCQLDKNKAEGLTLHHDAKMNVQSI